MRSSSAARAGMWLKSARCSRGTELPSASTLVALRPPRLTGGFRYLRFHGATGKYRGRYGKRALRPFAKSLLSSAGDAYVYFNNDHFGHAIRDAMDLGELLGEPLHSADAVRDARRADAAAVE